MCNGAYTEQRLHGVVKGVDRYIALGCELPMTPVANRQWSNVIFPGPGKMRLLQPMQLLVWTEGEFQVTIDFESGRRSWKRKWLSLRFMK